MGKIFYIMGKSSSGKDTIYENLLGRDGLSLHPLIMYTTRPIRAGETDGVQYHFVTEEQLKALKQAANDFKRFAEGEDLLGCVGADMQFHEIIYAATNNKRLQQMLLNLREQMYRYRMEYMKDKRMYKLLIDEHDAIRKAIKKKDKEKAGLVMRTHIINQQEAIERNLAGPEK